MTVRKLGIAVAVTAVVLVLAYDAKVLYDAYEAEAVARRKGFTCRWLTDSTGHRSRYVVFVPHVPPPETGYPVLLFLNGFGENGEDGTRQVSRNLGVAVWETKRRFPLLVVAPQCRANGSWSIDGPDRQRALETLEEVIQLHHGDRDRVYLTGPSSGGSGVLAVAADRPELFAAVVPLCAPIVGGHLTKDAAQIYASSGLPVWNFYNERDEPDLVAFNRKLQSELLRRGASPHWTEYDRAGHDCWDTAYRNPALYHWLLQQNRNARDPEFELASAGSPLAASLRLIHGTSHVDSEGLIWMEAAAGSELAAVALERFSSELEVHFECRLNGDDPVVIELQGESEESAAVHILIELPSQGGGGIFRTGSDECLAASDPVAQRALQRGRWNDIRLQAGREGLVVESNGWNLCSCAASTLPTGPWRVCLRTAARGDVFRFLRVPVGRESTSP